MNRQTIADALEGTRGEHDAAIIAQHGLDGVLELRDIASVRDVHWCEGCTRYVAGDETCKRKRRGCPLA